MTWRSGIRTAGYSPPFVYQNEPLVALGALVALVALVTSVACGVQPDRRSQRLAAKDIPFALLEEAGAPPTTAAGGAPLVESRVWLVAGTRLVPAARQLVRPVSTSKLLQALIDGPTEQEVAAGVRSAITPATTARLDASGTTAVVALAGAFSRSPTAEQLLVLAQVVYTLTELPTVEGVLFTIGGDRVEVPTADDPKSGPLKRADFATLVAPAPTPTTTTLPF